MPLTTPAAIVAQPSMAPPAITTRTHVTTVRSVDGASMRVTLAAEPRPYAALANYYA
ncbi:hypothetical protein GCM10011492_22050 [Flexivirga endophytica]|uniref:Uncharacterized protein n=1 Tax=Flexivirga endophytica TaxID=1849103 RepID=A0A916WSQ3_9MICO|nr:hypothetical protein GCM10011492_22050 [Flexivirga endophytica]GHB52009.1 hypothetical protein GCM10008112_21320 [Flexivirga endophytica]